jgi:hypothetical protein
VLRLSMIRNTTTFLQHYACNSDAHPANTALVIHPYESFPCFLILLNSLIQDATELGDMLSSALVSLTADTVTARDASKAGSTKHSLNIFAHTPHTT